MITVYVRHCDESEGYVLGEFDPECLAHPEDVCRCESAWESEVLE